MAAIAILISLVGVMALAVARSDARRAHLLRDLASVPALLSMVPALLRSRSGALSRRLPFARLDRFPDAGGVHPRIQNAALVRALGQIELAFTFAASTSPFASASPVELGGIVLVVGGILTLLLVQA